MTGAELLAVARHNCPPGMTDYQLALVFTAALGLLVPGLRPSQSVAIHRLLLRMQHEREDTSTIICRAIGTPSRDPA